jgi:phosphotriesterase-related protein
LTAELYRQVQHGILGTAVRPGILGELGTSAILAPCEERVLRAGARVARQTGLAINVHCEPPTVEVAHQILDVLAGEGHDLTRTYLSHLDEIADLDYHTSLLDRGIVVGFDSFGQDGYFSASWKSRSDLAKMTTAAALIEKGYGDQLVLAQDISRKHMLHALGGFGYDHVVRRVVPRLQELFGVDDAVVRAMLVTTPRRLLTIA